MLDIMSDVYSQIFQMPLRRKETELSQTVKDRLSSPDNCHLASYSAFW